MTPDPRLFEILTALPYVFGAAVVLGMLVAFGCVRRTGR